MNDHVARDKLLLFIQSEILVAKPERNHRIQPVVGRIGRVVKIISAQRISNLVKVSIAQKLVKRQTRTPDELVFFRRIYGRHIERERFVENRFVVQSQAQRYAVVVVVFKMRNVQKLIVVRIFQILHQIELQRTVADAEIPERLPVVSKVVLGYFVAVVYRDFIGPVSRKRQRGICSNAFDPLFKNHVFAANAIHGNRHRGSRSVSKC